MVWSPLLEVGKHHAPATPQSPIVIGSPRYYQVTGLKPPKAPKQQPAQATAFASSSRDKSDAMSVTTIDSLEKPILEDKQHSKKSSKLPKMFK
jgi:hypothetical protein